VTSTDEGSAVDRSGRPTAEAPPFRRLQETVIHEGHVVTLTVAQVQTPSGVVLEREIVHHPGAVAVVALLDSDRGLEAVLVRQYRAAVDQLLLEIPAGKRDVVGEDPMVAAARELQEEVGLAATELVHLSGFHNSPGFCDEFLDVYLAMHPVVVADDRQGVEEEAMTIERVPLSEVPAMIADGRLTDAKSIIGLLMAIRHLDSVQGR
jgi:ADP-ribose pyrophosphatase